MMILAHDLINVLDAFGEPISIGMRDACQLVSSALFRDDGVFI